MTVDELVEATTNKPQPAPRTRKHEPEKPVEEMSIDEMMKAAEESSQESGAEIKSAREIVESSEDDQVLWVWVRLANIHRSLSLSFSAE